MAHPYPSDGSATPNGGPDEDTRYWDLHSKEGQFTITYDFYSIPDTMDVVYDGQTIYQTGSINGSGSLTIAFGPGSSKLVQVIMNKGGNSNTGTLWQYTLRAKTDEDIQLFDNNDGSEIAEGDTAWITADPAMPALSGQPTTAILNANIDWKLKLSDSRIRTKNASYTTLIVDPKTKKKVPATSSYYYIIAPMVYDIPPFTETLAASAFFEPDFGHSNFLNGYDAFYGGKGTLSAVFASGKTATRNFTILGLNPTPASVSDYVNQQAPTLWYAPAIFQHESSNQQFFPDDQTKLYRDKPLRNYDLNLSFKKGEPNFGAPAGYGIGQYDAVANGIDRLDPALLWNWQANVDESLILMQTKRTAAVSYFAAVKAAALAAKKTYVDPPVFPNTNLSAVDAMAICLYNGTKGTLKVKVKGSRLSNAPYAFDANHGTWMTKDNINGYITLIYANIQSLQLSP